MDAQQGKVVQTEFASEHQPSALSHNAVTDITLANRCLWISTWGGGLNRYDLQTNTFTHLLNHIGKPIDELSRHQTCLLTDSEGHLWVGTTYGGVIQKE